MTLHATIDRVTDRIRERSIQSRSAYLAKIARAAEEGPRRAHLSCGNQAHAYAAMPDKQDFAETRKPNIGIVTAYNDMLSAHQPYERYPDLIRQAAHAAGATAQVAGGVPAMCDGVTQGRPGMELSLFSRDVIALASGVATACHRCHGGGGAVDGGRRLGRAAQTPPRGHPPARGTDEGPAVLRRARIEEEGIA